LPYLTSKNFFFRTPDKIPDADCPIIRTRGKFLISGTKAANIRQIQTWKAYNRNCNR